MYRKRVGVIRGGPSNEYEVSLKTGATVLKHLSQDKYNLREIFIDRNGNWFVNGIPLLPHDALTHVDVIFNALHGQYGEDGKLQQVLETHGIPFTGSGSFSSALGMNKKLTKDIYKKANLKTPQYRLIDSDENLNDKLYEIFRSFPVPLVVKPASSGSSVGISFVKDFLNFESAIREAFKHSNSVIVEEYITGKEATCGVIDSYRNYDYYPLPPVEIIPHEGTFFDYASKYEGKSNEIVPGNFTDQEKKEIERLAVEAHKGLGLSQHRDRSNSRTARNEASHVAALPCDLKAHDHAVRFVLEVHGV